MWRSLLFVPTLEERFIAKAATRGADAVVLDLEASVAQTRKEEARKALPSVVDRLSPDVPVAVRINPLWMAAVNDLDACVIPGVDAVHIAQCKSAEHVRAIDGILTDLEARRSLPAGAIRLVALIESAQALGRVNEIASASSRLVGLTLGVEDFATSMGVSAHPDLLRPAVCQLNQAASAAGVHSFAVPASLADFKDIQALKAEASYAKRIGSVGGYAVHPAQIECLNKVFSPTQEQMAWAEDVLAAAQTAHDQGMAVFKVAGQMIDQPLITRAKRFLGMD